jgi:hypothetical protein
LVDEVMLLHAKSWLGACFKLIDTSRHGILQFPDGANATQRLADLLRQAKPVWLLKWIGNNCDLHVVGSTQFRSSGFRPPACDPEHRRRMQTSVNTWRSTARQREIDIRSKLARGSTEERIQL